jgi:hypothetical protein
MSRLTIKSWALGFLGLLLLAGLCVSVIELLDNRGPLVPPPDKVTSFVELLDFGALVASSTPPSVELKRVTEGSGGGTGFKYDPDPSALFDGATSSKSIEFEMTCDAERRASLLVQLGDAITESLREWNSDVQIDNPASSDDSAEAKGFVLLYRAEGQSGDYEGEITVAVREVPQDAMRPSEAGQVIHSLSIISNESRWGHQ